MNSRVGIRNVSKRPVSTNSLCATCNTKHTKYFIAAIQKRELNPDSFISGPMSQLPGDKVKIKTAKERETKEKIKGRLKEVEGFELKSGPRPDSYMTISGDKLKNTSVILI